MNANGFEKLHGIDEMDEKQVLTLCRTAKHEAHVTESRIGHQREGFFRDLQNLVSFEFRSADQLLGAGNFVILSLVLSKLKHRSILKLCHTNSRSASNLFVIQGLCVLRNFSFRTIPVFNSALKISS